MGVPQVTHESLALPGYWRLASFGLLTHIPVRGTPTRIRAYLLQIGRDAPYDFAASEQRQWVPATIPIGEIPRLHLNAVIHNGKVLRRTPPLPINTRTETLYLDFSRQNVHVFGRHDRGEDRLIIPDTTGRLRHDPEGVSLYVAIGFNGDPYAYVVPCTEILRYFYATSSTIVAALFASDFLDPHNYLWDGIKSRIDTKTKTAFIQLRQRTLDIDAPFLARFAFDPYALKQAQLIFKYAAGHLPSQHGDRVVRALPPISGPVKLRATIVPIHTGSHERALITKIHSCDWGAPFSSLEHDRDNDGRFNPKDREGKPRSKRRRCAVDVPPEPPPEDLTLSAGAPSSNVRRWALEDEEIADRFPELAKIPVVKAPQTRTKTAGTTGKLRVLNPSGGKGSVERPTSSNDVIAPVLIQGIEDMARSPSALADDVDAGPPDAPHRVTMGLLRTMAAKSLATVEFLRVTEHYALVDGAALCVFPAEICGLSSAWLYLDKEKTHRRMAVVASVEKQGETRYLIDIQQRREHECSMIVCWSGTEAELPAEYLHRAINACAEAKGASLRSADYLELSWNRLKHTATSVDEAEAKYLLGRIFAMSRLEKPC